ncbi:hypothetical protein MMC24_003362 [Lignoscripta atroalba]|nr:hypothetical protein [Lignoscripta atroalba]
MNHHCCTRNDCTKRQETSSPYTNEQADSQGRDCQSTKAPSKASCYDDGDCSIPGTYNNEPQIQVTERDSASIALANGPGDLEKGIAVSEHVILSVQGMTCVGCESKLYNSLRGLRSVDNIQTSLVLSRAEFDIDASVSSASDIIRLIKRMTHFSCERVTDKGYEIDVMSMGTPNAILDQPLPPGVTNMALLDKHTVRISYDPKAIGARDLLESGFNTPLQVAPPQIHPSVTVGKKHVHKMGYLTLLSAVLTIPVLVLAWAPISPQRPLIYGAVSLVLASIIQLVIAGPFYPSALKSLIFSRVMEMDLLIVLSTSSAYVYSVVCFGYIAKGNALSTGDYFESSTLLVTFIMLGRYVSAFARQKAVESISIRSLQSSTAILVTSGGKEEKVIDARLLQYGDVFKVSPDYRIVTDGTVIAGTSDVDESMVTGETGPVEKAVRCGVIAGSVNGSGTLKVRVTRLPGDNTISTIAGMMDEAKLSKPKVQDLADQVSGYFVPVIIVLTIITFVIWTSVCITVREQSASKAAIQAITYAIAVLIVSCPCAIGLAVPMVIAIAGGVAAEHGVIIKSAGTIEVARKVSHVIFDKTGTLTQGKLSVTVEEYHEGPQPQTRSLLLGLTSNINHPVSSAVAKHLKALNVIPAQLENIRSQTGKGVEGDLNGTTIRAGNSRWLGVESCAQVHSLLSRGLTVFCVVVDDKIAAVFGLEDSLRPDALTVVTSLISRGISISIISGDDDGAVQSVAAKLGIPTSNTKSCCVPADKQKYVKELIAANHKNVVLFCGDGTNDAVALAQADVGVHMNEGTDLAQSAADAVLMRPALRGILVLMDLSRAAFSRIVFNFAWAFTYNLFAVLLAAGAFVHARIPPEYAGLGEIVSVLPVILIALQLKWARM